MRIQSLIEVIRQGAIIECSNFIEFENATLKIRNRINRDEKHPKWFGELENFLDEVFSKIRDGERAGQTVEYVITTMKNDIWSPIDDNLTYPLLANSVNTAHEGHNAVELEPLLHKKMR